MPALAGQNCTKGGAAWGELSILRFVFYPVHVG
jgi:hypothetical protein